MFRENVVEGNSHRPFRLGKSRPFRIGTVGHQRQYPFLSNLRKPLKINGIPEYRRIIHLKITCVHHDPRRRIDRQSRRILNTVVRLDKFNPELAQIDGLSVAHHFPPGAAQKIVFAKFPLNDTHRKLSRIDRKIHLPQHIRKSADMVFMAVGDHKSLDFLTVFLQVGNVRDHQIDSKHVVLRKGQTAVHDNNTVFIFKGSNVHSDLLQTSERNDSQFSIVFFFQTYTSTCFSVLFSSAFPRHSRHCP